MRLRLARVVYNASVLVANYVHGPAMDLHVVLLRARSIMVTGPNAVRAHRVAIVHDRYVVFGNFHLVVLCASARFMASARSFIVPFMFNDLLGMDGHLFQLIRAVVVVRVVVPRTRRHREGLVHGDLFMPFRNFLIVFRAEATPRRVVVSRFGLNMAVVLFHYPYRVFRDLLQIFLRAIAILVDRPRFDRATKFILLYPLSRPLRYLIPILLHASSLFMAASRDGSSFVFVHRNDFYVPNGYLLQLHLARCDFFRVGACTRRYVEVTFLYHFFARFGDLLVTSFRSITVLMWR